MRRRILTYSDLIKNSSFEERYEYLRIPNIVGETTFGSSRFLNQNFYHSREWKQVRSRVILRDMGCDLGIKDREIFGGIIVHHMNPLTEEDVLERTEFLLNEEYLICVSHNTHQAIHFGDKSLLIPSKLTERKPNDTIPWK